MTFKELSALLLCCGLACAGEAWAQPATPSPDSPAPLGTSPDYQLGPGDMVSIRVSGLREFDQAVRVSNSGRIRVPYVGIVYAAGVTALELEREIAQKIREHELVNEPMVRVQIDQYRARPVHIVGEVTTPGQFVITDQMYLLDLITRAGGLTPGADATGILYRRGTVQPSVTARLLIDPPAEELPSPAPEEAPRTPAAEPLEGPDEPQVIPINLDDLREGTRPELNIRLQGGDVLYVPRRRGQNIYIIGDVKVPGAYTLPRRGTVSAAQAVIYAGGPLMTAKNGSAFLMRHDENGVRQAIPVDFMAIIRGEEPDIPVQADDIIFIPNSATKTIAVSLLNQIPRLIQQLVIF